MNLDIPKAFYSDTDDQPFHECKVCGNALDNDDVPYTIEKAYKRVSEGEDVTLFEIAICIPCAEAQSKKMSEESRAYMMRKMSENGFMEKREALWNSDWKNRWNAKCLFTNNEVKVNEEYHIVGHFLNGKIIEHAAPFVLGNQFIEDIQENLSLETKEEMDRFGEQFLGPDPALRALLKEHQFVMI